MVKVAFVGCGGIQAVHQKNLAGLDGVQLVGHCDILEGRAEERAREFGGEPFTHYEEMYDKTKPDAVFVAVPPYAHVGMEEAAAERGIHLFVEKPIALDRKTAQRIAGIIRQSKILSSVGYCMRYHDTVSLARKYLKGKAISLVLGFCNGGMPQTWWWRQMQKSGGQIVEQSTHVIDLARYLCGDVAEVYAAASTGCMTQVEDFDVHDSSVLNARLKNGAVATFTASCVMEHEADVALRVISPDATVSFEGGNVTISEDGRTTHYRSKTDMYAEEARVFIDAVRTGRKSKIRSSYGDAFKTFLATCAANESIESGMPVKP